MRAAVLLHLFYPDVAIELIERVAKLDRSLDILVTSPGPLAAPVKAALDRLPHRVEIVEVANRGWDVGPLFAVLPRIVAGGYDLVCKLHTKKGGSGYAAEWRDLFHEGLAASDALVSRILATFEAEPRLDLLGPAALYKSAAQNQWQNGDRLAALTPALTAPRLPPSDWGFFAGTMFWARTASLERLAPFARFDDDGHEDRDGALAHALERLIGLAPFAAGHLIGLVIPDGAGDGAIELVAAPGAPSHEPMLTTLVTKAEAHAGEMTPALAALIARENPLIDYLRHGRDADALDPNPYFSSTWYNQVNADVAAAGMHPFEHYVHHGAFEDRSTSQLFDMGYYRTNNPEIAAGRLDPLRHFLEIGLPQGQSAIPLVSDSAPEDGKGDGAPRRFYRHFDLLREQAFLDRLEALPKTVRATAAKTRFSVVMPAWNRAATVGQAIRSVIGQTHQFWELLVVDDGSTDGTIAAIEPFLADPRIRLIRGNHGGVSAARNLGLEAATGDLVAYLDSDNRWKPGFLEGMALFMAAEKLEAAYSALELRDDLGQLIGYHGADFDWGACLERNYVDLNAFVHARGLYETLGGFDPKLRRMVDWDLILRYGRDRKVGYAPFVGCDYRDGKADAQRITVAEPLAFLKLVQAKHDGSAGQPIALSFAIKIAAPEEEKEAWGDWHFADSLAEAIRRLGHVAHVDFRDRWHVRPPAEEDVVIVLRGLIAYEPRPGQIALLWNISHPDQLGFDEMEAFSRVYVASQSTADWLGAILGKPVTALLQATDPERFHPPTTSSPLSTSSQRKLRSPEEDAPAPELLFCGNSRGVDRPVVDWAIAAGHPPRIIGGGWQGTAAESLVTAETIDNRALGKLYAGAGAVLNDHWTSMRAFGYVSNRLFDVVAAGGRAISDPVPSIAAIFGDAVRQVDGPDALGAAVTAALADRAIPSEVADIVRTHHSFDARARQLVADAQAILGLPTIETTPPPPGPATRRLRVHAIVPYGQHGPQSSAYIRLLSPLTDETVNGRIAFSFGAAGEPLPDCDVVIVQRAALESVDQAEALILAIGRLGATLVTDVDDAFILMEADGHPEAAAYGPRNAALNRIIAASAETWFSTAELRNAYAGIAHRTAIVPNQLDPRLWRDWRAAPRPLFEDDRIHFLYMGTATHAADYALIRPAFDRLAETHADRFDLTLIGVAPHIAPAPWLRRLSPPAGAIAYPKFVRWLRDQGPFDIGLAPLADTDFNRCKSDIKLLDYAALGLLPVVADSPAYAADPSAATHAVLVRQTEVDWYGALAGLVEDPHRFVAGARVLTDYVFAERSTLRIADRLRALVGWPKVE